MEMTEFDVNEWLSQGQSARASLKRREAEILREIKTKQDELEEVRVQMKRVGDILGEDSSQPERRSGVLALTRKVVKGLNIVKDDHGHDLGWREEVIVRNVLDADPLMKASSIANALRRMSKNEELDRLGPRGHYSYRLKDAAHSEHVQEAPPRERIHAALVSAGDKGAHLRDLSWILGDSGATTIVLDAMMHDKAVETFPVGDGDFHYRLLVTDAESDDEPEPSIFNDATPPS